MHRKRSTAPDDSPWRRPGVMAAAVLIAAATLWNALAVPSETPPDVDGDYYLTAALNLTTAGVYDTRRGDDPIAHHPTREPLYPALLAGAVQLDGLLGGEEPQVADDVDCLVEGATPACRSPHRRWKLLNGLLYAALVALTWVVAGRWLSAGWRLVPTAVVATSTAVVGYVDVYYTELLAAPLLLGASAALSGAGRRPLRAAAVTGALMGLLALTKAVFLYVLPLLAPVLWWTVRRGGGSRRRAGATVVVLLAVGLAVPAPWMARNAETGNGWAITTGADAVAMTRLSYDAITAREAGMAVVWWSTPTYGPPLAEALWGPEAVHRLDRDAPDGYYEGHERARDLVQAEGLTTVARRRLVPHVLLTPLVAWRGTVPWAQFYPPPDAVTAGTAVSESVGRLFLPALLALAWVDLRRRRPDRLGLLAPTLASVALYAAFTHYLPRYSVPSLPVLAIALAVVARAVVTRSRRRDGDRDRPPSADEEVTTDRTSPVVAGST